MTVIGKWIWLSLILIVFALLSGCVGIKTITEPQPSPPPPMLLDYHRTGGVAGVDDRLVVFDNGVGLISTKASTREIQLNQTQLKMIEALFGKDQFFILESTYSARAGSADLMKYTISYHGKTVSAEDSAIPPTLMPVIEQLNLILKSGGSLEALAPFSGLTR